MKLFLSVTLCSTLLMGAQVVQVGERFENSQQCRTCHNRIVSEWSHSWHAKSHYNNDEYFQKSIDYVSRKSRKSLNAVKVQCATCHNPRISVTSTDESYEIAAVMELDNDSEVNKAVDDNSISEGVNCVVCHNIDKIHDEYDETKRGIDRVEWTPSGTMTGPYQDAKSPYHKTIHHDFMDKTPNKLCFVCHANDRSIKGVVFTNMQKEYKGNQSCVECHMGERHKDVAATYQYNGKTKIRDVRHHGFAGAHTKKLWKDALSLQLSQTDENLIITINNPQPHNIPSGFGAREILVHIEYRNSKKVLKRSNISLSRNYTRKRNKITIPHLALQQTKDLSIPAKGKRVLKHPKLLGATEAKVTLYYRLVNTTVYNLLDLKEKKWREKYLITSKTLKL